MSIDDAPKAVQGERKVVTIIAAAPKKSGIGAVLSEFAVRGVGTRRSAKIGTFGGWAPGVGSVSPKFFAHVKMFYVALQRVQKNLESDMY